MHQFELGPNRWLLRLVRGEELMETLRAWMSEHDVGAATVKGIGAALGAELAYYVLDEKRYETFAVSEPTEVTSVVGNLSRLADDRPQPHLHATLGRRGGPALGGHVTALVVGATLELDVEVFPGRLRRQPDDEIGLDLIDARE